MTKSFLKNCNLSNRKNIFSELYLASSTMVAANSSTIIPTFLAGWIQLLVPGDCFDEFFVKYNFFDGR